MGSPADLRRYRENLEEERRAVRLYERLSTAEPDPVRSSLYRTLADTERRHAAVWEHQLQAAGAPVPPWRADWRSGVLGWLAGWFGVGLVLPTITEIERATGTRYDGQREAEEAGMPADERAHARLFQVLSTQSGGMEGSAVAKLEGRHRGAGGNALRAGVLGANDGLVSVLSLVMGVAGAAMESHTILVTGLAGLLAGAISMAMGEWLSVQSSRELYTRQLDIERRELEETPEEEKAELALIYQAKGVPAAEAQKMADRLLSDPAHALDTLSREELGVDPDELGGSAWVAASTSFVLFAAGAIIPITPYFFTSGSAAILWSSAFSALGLFVIGAGITLVTGKNLWISGVRQIGFGLAAAGVTYGIGRLVGVQLGG